jgi:hypothetical protein
VTADRVELDETFRGDDLDRAVWSPHYLPHWSSRAASAATYEVRGGELRLTIPPDQPRWCPDLHEEPLRVSCIQSASWSGPVGSTRGPQPFRPGLVVREEQSPFWGYIQAGGHVEVRMRGVVSARSMFAFWMSGIEDEPERSGEICVAEIFGDAISGGSAEVGMGIRRFLDPALTGQWDTERLELDPTEFHTYGADWRTGSTRITIDGRVVRHLDQAPDYPLQLMIGVFDFPDRAVPEDDDPVPELVVSHVRGHGTGHRSGAGARAAGQRSGGSPGSGPVATG